jgi:HD superfamily phosphohydrolase
MDFLQDSRRKILRTRLYGDQTFTRFELELLHTPIVQRLYNLKQLGFTDRVYPDAIHTRFNHILGATEVVEQMAEKLIVWLRAHPGEQFAYYFDEAMPSSTVTGENLAGQLERNIQPLRLMAMLHDLTHAAFGHTLEDEVNVFDEKHDDPRRQTRFFNALVAQLLYLWCTEEQLQPFEGTTLEDLSELNISAGSRRELRWAEELAAYLGQNERTQPQNQRAQLANHLRELELALQLLLHLDYMHNADHQEPQDRTDLLVSQVAKIIDPDSLRREFVVHRDIFMLDLVGNTICADLLDYARRDADNAGLRIQFDDRFLRYLGVTSVKDELSPTRKPCIRTAIQIFTHKMRHDVLSEVSGILKARYLINERVLFHPTKCAAGAMLGTAVQLLGLRDLPGWMQVLGDQELLRKLIEISRNLEALVPSFSDQLARQESWVNVVRSAWSADGRMAGILEKAIMWILPDAAAGVTLDTDQIELLLKRAQSARNVIWRLMSRRFPKLAYRLRTAHQTGGASDETIAETYSRPADRYALERSLEETCHLPMGSIFIHCPRRKTSMKVAEVLVVGADISKAAQLRDLTKVSPEGLGPYEQEIRAVEEMYLSIWQFHAYLDVAFWNKQPIVEWALERKLNFDNDQLLEKELTRECHGAYALLAGKLKDDIAPVNLPMLIKRVDEELTSSRMRLSESGEDLESVLRRIIREVNAQESADGEAQLHLGFDKQ